MTTEHRSGQLRSTGGQLARHREKRIAWLLAHPEDWTDLPDDQQDVTDDARAALIAIGRRMVADGVYSSRTEVSDRTWGIRVLIGEARARQVQPRCNHKFIDSNVCLKCGWTP